MTDDYSLYINCGGQDVITNGTYYQSDIVRRAGLLLYRGPNWAVTSSGSFMDTDGLSEDGLILNNTYTVSNISKPLDQLYMNARASPITITYYGMCLLNGPYSVKLHFSELSFTADQTFNSLGRRFFDVYVQVKFLLL